MKILVTGAGGFLGRNLIDRLSQDTGIEVLAYHHSDGEEHLRELCSQADFIFHLAAVCRPKDPADFHTVNVVMLQRMLQHLEHSKNHCPIVFSSSIQAAMDGRFGVTEYGRTKRDAERLLLDYSDRTGARTLIYRLPNLFGKWGTPEYNNVMHTFCHHIAHGLPIRIDNPATVMQIHYVEDLLDDWQQAITDTHCQGYIPVTPIYEASLGSIADTLRSFKAGLTPSTPLEHKLHATLLAY